MDDIQLAAPASDLLTTKQVAEEYGLAVITLNTWRVKGKGPPFYKLGRLVRYDSAETAAWMRSRRYRSTSEETDNARTS